MCCLFREGYLRTSVVKSYCWSYCYFSFICESHLTSDIQHGHACMKPRSNVWSRGHRLCVRGPEFFWTDTNALLVGVTWYFLFNPHNFGIRLQAGTDGPDLASRPLVEGNFQNDQHLEYLPA